MDAFDFQPRTRVIFGADRIDQLGELAMQLGGGRAVLVCDRGIIAAGHTERAVSALRRTGMEVVVFDDVHENPTTEDVERGRAFVASVRPDLLIGLGGGSSMDCAKGINFLHTNGGRMQDYWGVDKATRPMLPMIAVPTTAGTGSEAQSFALISDAETHVKMACGDKKAAFRIAVLDPKLTLTQPPRVTALSGLDAISHAVETYVTTRRNTISRSLSREAWRLLGRNFPRVIAEPQDLEARGAMQLGACFAGLAIENSMLGAAHALANPLTATLDIVHGQAVSAMLPHVVRFNATTVGPDYAELMRILQSDVCLPTGKSDERRDCTAEGLADYLAGLVSAAGLSTQLRHLRVEPRQFDDLAEDAARQWTGTFNPRPVDATTLRELYAAAY